MEAAVVMPFLCMLLAITLQMILYLHDVSVFVSVAYEAAQKGAEAADAGQKEKEERAEKAAIELLEERRLACSEYTVKADAAGTKVRVTIQGRTNFLQGVSVEVQKEVWCGETVAFLRNWKRVKNLWEKLK